jgi:transcriptional regulator with GAF, ATPase, and Fis domain
MILLCSDIFSSKNTKEDSVIVVDDLNILMKDEDFDNDYICVHLLNKLVQITESEFGFITTLTNDQRLCGHTSTDFAWNELTKHIFVEEFSSLEFPIDHPAFTRVLSSEKACIIHDPPSFLPEGHPTIKQILCIPIKQESLIIGVLGVCNKFEKYSKQDIVNVQHVLNSPPTHEIIKKYICNYK